MDQVVCAVQAYFDENAWRAISVWKEIAREGMDISLKFGYPCMDAVLPFFSSTKKNPAEAGEEKGQMVEWCLEGGL